MQHTPNPRSVNKPSQPSHRSDSAVSKFGNHGEQRHEHEPRGAQQKHEKHEKLVRKNEFDLEYEGKTVKITLHNGTTVLGKAETSKYWLKIVSPSGKCIYVNKAYVVLIEPAE